MYLNNSVTLSQTEIKKKGELIFKGPLHNLKEPVAYVYMVRLDCKNEVIDSGRVINNKYSFRVQFCIERSF